MSSAKQIEANRRNAQKSKGPRTAAGKARASCNSRKHALSTISRSNPRFAPRIECIARVICPETANSGLWEQALIIGECATVLGCVQAERIALIEHLLGGTTARISDAEGAGTADLEAPQCKPAPPQDELEVNLMETLRVYSKLGWTVLSLRFFSLQGEVPNGRSNRDSQLPGSHW